MHAFAEPKPAAGSAGVACPACSRVAVPPSPEAERAEPRRHAGNRGASGRHRGFEASRAGGDIAHLRPQLDRMKREKGRKGKSRKTDGAADAWRHRMLRVG